MAELGPQRKQVHQDSDGEEDDDHEDVEPSPPLLKNFRETMEDVRSFLEFNGNMAEATKAEELMNNVAWLQCSTTRYTVQEKITSYFQPGSSTTHPSPPTYSLPTLTHHPPTHTHRPPTRTHHNIIITLSIICNA